ncbi:MAG TPA: hypothetical protein VLU46_04225 [Thermoanaerobaculia bacterium]|nr:hypothetical protein [Thermoanaerobaculia bacterium]
MKRFALALAVTLALPVASAQTPGSGRLSLFGTSQRTDLSGGDTRDFGEMTAALTLRYEVPDNRDTFEYALDVRQSAYQSTPGRPSRTRLYDAWLGGRIAGGRLALRAGHLWLYDLGALGSVGGAMAEYRSSAPSTAGRFRAGVFAGLEPKPFDAGYINQVKKGGAWLAFDAAGSRRHVLGYVQIRNARLTERSVITTMNFIPIGRKFFLYQTGEYDLAGPGGTGHGGLNYFFANARFMPVQRVELLATYHHGRSIDARTITDDILNGRPVDQKLLDGFMFESAGGRMTVEVVRGFRVYAGYSADRHNADQKATGRATAGLWASNIAHTGIDFTLSDYRTRRPTGGDDDAWFASIGRSIGPRFYISADYSTSLAVITVLDGNTTVERRPRSKRYGLNTVWNIHRAVSLLLSGEQFADEFTTDNRMTFGLVYRF